MRQIYAGLPLREQRQALYIILPYFISQDCHIVHAFPLKTACHVQKKADQSMISPHDAMKVFVIYVKANVPVPYVSGTSGPSMSLLFPLSNLQHQIHLGEIIIL